VLPVRADKRPAIPSWKQFQQERVSVAQVEEWARQIKPRAWAVVTGAISGVIVLDFDGDTGNQTIKKLGLAPHVRTGSGGHHVYIEHPGFRVATLNGKTKEQLAELYPGLDIRADGGYAIFSGSTQAGPYKWLRPPEPEAFDSLPPDLQAFLKQSSKEAADSASTARKPRRKSNGRSAVDLLITQALESAASDGRNNAGFALARQLRDYGWSLAEAEQVVLEYAARVPSTNVKGQPEKYSTAEARASLRQAYSRPARKPETPTSDGQKSSSTDSNVALRRFDVRNTGVFYIDSDPDKEPFRICSVWT